jgi:hypothetical protein
MSRSRVWPLLLALALLALPAYAEVFHVTLKNGTVIETANRPQQANWDANMVLLLTDMGNWVGFPKDDIAGVREDDPIQGFGIRINAKVVALGVSPNDLPEGKGGKDDPNQRFLDMANRMLDMADQQQRYSVQQFVEPNQTQGIPAAFAGNSYGGNAGGAAASALGGLGGAGFGGGMQLESDPGRFVTPEGGMGAPSVTSVPVSPPQ